MARPTRYRVTEETEGVCLRDGCQHRLKPGQYGWEIDERGILVTGCCSRACAMTAYIEFLMTAAVNTQRYKG